MKKSETCQERACSLFTVHLGTYPVIEAQSIIASDSLPSRNTAIYLCMKAGGLS